MQPGRAAALSRPGEPQTHDAVKPRRFVLIFKQDLCHSGGMTDISYRVVPGGKGGFDVEMERPDGRKRTVPGFFSEHEAEAWIIQAKRLIRDTSPWTPLPPRKPAPASVPVDAAVPPAAPAASQAGAKVRPPARESVRAAG